MRLILSQGFDVGDAQFFAGYAEFTQAEVLRQGVVLAIGFALDQGLDGGGPVIGLTPDARVVLKGQLLIEEAIDRGELLALGLIAFALQQLAPGLDSFLRRTEWAVACIGGLQDPRETPVGKDIAQACQKQTCQQQPSAEPKSER